MARQWAALRSLVLAALSFAEAQGRLDTMVCAVPLADFWRLALRNRPRTPVAFKGGRNHRLYPVRLKLMWHGNAYAVSETMEDEAATGFRPTRQTAFFAWPEQTSTV